MRRPSWLAWVILPLAVALAGNLATNTVQVDAAWWPPAAWGAVIVLCALSVLVERRASPPRRTTEQDLTKVVDALAKELKGEWRALLESEPGEHAQLINLKWSRVDAPELIDHWANVNQSDNDVPPLTVHGLLDGVAKAYSGIPSGRLVILGRPGAGKSIAAVHCAAHLVSDRESGQPVPYVVSFKSWSPDVDLSSWLVARLEAEHPELAAIGPSDKTLAAGLVAGRLVLPILDGFDELPPQYQYVALRHLNDQARRPLIVTSRVDQYGAVVAETRVLNAAAVIALDDLSEGVLVPYLRTSATGRRAGIWEPVIGAVRRPSPDPAGRQVLDLLSTPLMVYLACARYSDHNSDADPAELLDTRRFPSRAALEHHLIAEFLPAVYRRRSGEKHRWSAADAHRWLSAITREMRLMDVDRLSRYNVGAPLVDPLRSFGSSLIVGVTCMLPFGAVAALMFDRRVGNGILLTAVFAFALDYALRAWRGPGSPPFASTGDLEPDRRNRFERWTDDHLSVPVRVYLLAPIIALVPAAIGWFVVGPPFAIAFWAATYVVETYWVPWLLIARLWLPLTGRLPWRQRAFLEDASVRGVLRRVGTRYQVRHALLQNYLTLSADARYGAIAQRDPAEHITRPIPAVLDARKPHLRFTTVRRIITFAGTAAAAALLARQEWLRASDSLWWLFTLPVAVMLGVLVFVVLSTLFRPFERFRLRLEPDGLVVEVVVGKSDIGSERSTGSRLIEWQQIDHVEEVTVRGRAHLVLHTFPGLPPVAALRGLPRYEPSLGENALLVCPLDYFDPAVDLVPTLRAAQHSYIAKPPACFDGGCVADLDQGVSADTVAALAAEAWWGGVEARRRIDEVVNGLYERHEHNGLELRHCPLATALDALVHRKADVALFDLQDQQEAALIATAIDLIKNQPA
ncbi:hypothetical protein OHB24_33695 [Kribbella sp. NBC_00482]|uniref:NACHT domain-containing protein n=1 Tax=Kribbella sp. NBC_00482 TaxID=2975968 RepID=UPI002E194761